MKHPSKFLLLLFATTFSACHLKAPKPTANLATDTFSRFISIDSANKMIGSYLNSIDYTHNDTDIQSLIIDVHQLRRYIDSMAGSNNISYLKLMFAHTLSLTNSPLANNYIGYKNNGFTIVIAAYNASNNVIYYNNNMVLDYAQPCPPACPGTLNDTLLTNH